MTRHSINFLDLFDWEKEADRDYIYLLEHEKQLEEEYYAWDREQESLKRKPAKIEILTLIKKEDEISSNPLPF